MGADYQIIARAEREQILVAPSEHRSVTALGTFDEIIAWFKDRATCHFSIGEPAVLGVKLGKDCSVPLRLETPGTRKYGRQHSPRGDEPVFAIHISLYGDGKCDFTALAEAALWFDALIFDGQTTEVLEPVEWLNRCS